MSQDPLHIYLLLIYSASCCHFQDLLSFVDGDHWELEDNDFLDLNHAQLG